MSLRTTLNGAVTATATSIVVTSATDYPMQQFRIAVDAEEMTVIDGFGTTTWTVQRDSFHGGQLTVVHFDDFERDEVDSLGVTSEGLAWRHDGTDASFDYNVNGSRGTLQFLQISADGSPLLPLVTKPLNVQARILFSPDMLPSVGDTNSFHLRVRETEGGGTRDCYRARVIIASNGDATLRLAKQAGGSSTLLGSNVVKAGLVSAGGEYWIALEAIGVNPTTVSMKVWDAAGAEPGAWDSSVTDSEIALQDAGEAVCFRLENTAAAVNMPLFELDDLTVMEVPVGVAHASGATVALIEPWEFPLTAVGYGPPTVDAPSGAEYMDVSNVPPGGVPDVYYRQGTVWYRRSFVSAAKWGTD